MIPKLYRKGEIPKTNKSCNIIAIGVWSKTPNVNSQHGQIVITIMFVGIHRHTGATMPRQLATCMEYEIVPSCEIAIRKDAYVYP